MRYTYFFLGFAFLLIQSGCQKTEWLNDGEYFFLKNKDAVMPVWVKGNRTSEVYIITVHGGPGATSGHEFPISQGFRLLEEDYNLVYWDQRMSGLSQGDPDPVNMTVDQHIEDLDKLISLIKTKYNPGSIFLLGHSWGGVMTGGYLGRENNQNGINGWIDVDGSIQEAYEVQEMKKWVLDRVPSHYDDAPEFYQFIIDWYEENPEPPQSAPFQYYYSSILGGYSYDYEYSNALSPVPYDELIFQSPFTFAFYWTQFGSEGTWADGYDVTDDVKNIIIPSLLLWGKEDGVVTASVAQFTHDLLGTPLSKKQIVLIEESAHSPHYDRPNEFYSAIETFVEANK